MSILSRKCQKSDYSPRTSLVFFHSPLSAGSRAIPWYQLTHRHRVETVKKQQQSSKLYWYQGMELRLGQITSMWYCHTDKIVLVSYGRDTMYATNVTLPPDMILQFRQLFDPQKISARCALFKTLQIQIFSQQYIIYRPFFPLFSGKK